MITKQWYGKKKIVLLILICLVAAFAIYAGIDQVIFQCQKTDDIAVAKQYLLDTTAAGNITEEQMGLDKETIIASQREKINQCIKKYPQEHEADSEMWNIYLEKLEERLGDGWKWHDVKIGDLRETSAWKSPLEANPHVKLIFSRTVTCDSGGAVIGNGSTVEEEAESEHTMRQYICSEFVVSGLRNKTVWQTTSASSNQADFLSSSSSSH